MSDTSAPLPPSGKIEEYAKAVAGAYGMSIDEIKAKGRQQPAAFARQLAITLAVKEGRHDKQRVATYFGRDYATITHSIRRVEDELATSKRVADLYKKLKSQLS